MDFAAALQKFKYALMHVLPVSPFQSFISQFHSLPWLGWLNWFIPVRACMTVFAAWLAALVIYYLYRIILRWIKAVS